MEKKPINVLSLFDGKACGKICLDKSGIPVARYLASEIDPYAIQVAKKNHPSIEQIGDVEKIIVSELPHIDLVIGGSPCQGLSFAGLGLNFEDPRSKLFYEYARILKELQTVNPELLFLLENVKMKQEHQDIISDILGIQPIYIDSKICSATSRKRLYWTNIPNVTLPKENDTVLSDILEYGFVDRDKSYCIDANYFKGGNLNQYFKKSRRQLVFLTEDEIARAKLKYTGKTWKSGKRMGNMRFPDDASKKARSLPSTVIKGARETIHIEDKDGIRILTPLECERLHNLPEGYTEGVSNTQRYKMIGNGWECNTVTHIFSHIYTSQPLKA